MELKTVLEQKNIESIVDIQASQPVLAAIQKMCDHQVGALLVVSEASEPLGIISERDIMRFCSSRAGEISTILIDEVMTKDLIIATPQTTVDEAMSIMTEKKFRHLPIVAEGNIEGLLSIGDLVKAKLNETAVEVKYLRDYIAMN